MFARLKDSDAEANTATCQPRGGPDYDTYSIYLETAKRSLGTKTQGVDFHSQRVLGSECLAR